MVFSSFQISNKNEMIIVKEAVVPVDESWTLVGESLFLRLVVILGKKIEIGGFLEMVLF